MLIVFSAPPMLAGDIIIYLFTCSFLVFPWGLLLPSTYHLLLTSVQPLPFDSSSTHSSLRPQNPVGQATLRAGPRSSLTWGGQVSEEKTDKAGAAAPGGAAVHQTTRTSALCHIWKLDQHRSDGQPIWPLTPLTLV